MSAENTLAQEKVSSGKKLLRFAWTIEILAAFIGLMIAWAMGFETYVYYLSETGSFPLINLFDIVLAALPFVMVASVELVKIPLCRLVYLNKSFKVRFFFSIVLILVTFITFETLVSGFERNLNNISMKVSIPQAKLNEVNQKIALIDEEIEELQQKTENTVRNEVNIRRAQAEKSRDSQVSILEDQKEEYFKLGNQVFLSKKNNVEEEISRTEERRKQRVDQMQAELKIIGPTARQAQLEQRKVNEEQIKQLTKSIQDKKAEIKSFGILAVFQTELKDKVVKLESKINKLMEQNAKVSLGPVEKLNSEIKQLNLETENTLDKLYNDLKEIQVKLAQDTKYKTQIETLSQKIGLIQTQYSKEIDTINKFREKETKDIGEKSAIIKSLEKERKPLRQERSDLGLKISDAYKGTQIYRIATRAFSLKAGQFVTEEQINTVAFFWFGGLAFIISVMGVFLAFGSFIIMYSGPGFDDLNQSGPGPLRRALISALEARKKRYTDPKVVTKIKEVEVEKIVKETVEVDKIIYKEVPKEVVRREVVHVPIYTNDPDLLKFGTTKVKDIMGDK